MRGGARACLVLAAVCASALVIKIAHQLQHKPLQVETNLVKDSPIPDLFQESSVICASWSADDPLNQTLRNSSDISKQLQWLTESHEIGDEDLSIIRTEQLQLMTNIELVCQTKRGNSRSPRKIDLTKFYKFQNAVYCKLPKTGSTNILNELCQLMGPKCMGIVNTRYHPHIIVPKFLARPTPTELRQTNDLFKFVVVRNPWARLVSSYIQKVLTSTEYIQLCKVNVFYSEFQRLMSKRKQGWSFSDFLDKCVIEAYDRGGPIAINEHFRPLSNMAKFCDVKYNFISKLENAKREHPVILKMLNAKDVDEVMEKAYTMRRSNEKLQATKNSYESTWKAVSPQRVARLRHIYLLDILLLNYPTDPLTKSGNSCV